jgi:hypothetical protein
MVSGMLVVERSRTNVGCAENADIVSACLKGLKPLREFIGRA